MKYEEMQEQNMKKSHRPKYLGKKRQKKKNKYRKKQNTKHQKSQINSFMTK